MPSDLNSLPYAVHPERRNAGPAVRTLASRLWHRAARGPYGTARKFLCSPSALEAAIARGREQAQRVDLPPAVTERRAVLSRAARSDSRRLAPAATRVHILAYHQIAGEGPASLARFRTPAKAFAEQLSWLRRNGFESVTSSDIWRSIHRGEALPGRSVLFTFDDGYRDFAEAAFPLLQAHGFGAEVMIVTEQVGGRADWDIGHGAADPLMNWCEIRRLSAAGIRFGSHMATHSHMADLSTARIAEEASRSRSVLERALGVPCHSIAAPYGEVDGYFDRVAEACGYTIGFTAQHGVASAASAPLRLPRIEVRGGWSISDFARAMDVAAPSLTGRG